MTPEEIYSNLLREYLSESFSSTERLNWAVDSFMILTEQQTVIYNAMEEYGKQQWNEAIKLASIEATTKEVGCYDGGFDNHEFIVDSQSILKLLK